MIDTLSVLIFFLGAMIGSFLNVCIYRLPRGESIIYPRSHCPRCGGAIRWWDNIPLVSFLLLRARCRQCGEKISFRYPLVELITASLFMTTYLSYGIGGTAVAYMVLISSLIVAGLIDWDKRVIPNWITLPGILVGWGLSSVANHVHFWESLLGTVVGGGILTLVGLFGKLIFRKESMGGGDVKLIAMIGAFLGWKQVIVVLFLSFLIGAIGGTALILSGKSFKQSRQIPFGPFISFATIIVLFYGELIVNAYLGSFVSR